MSGIVSTILRLRSLVRGGRGRGRGNLLRLPYSGGFELYSQRKYLLLLKVMPFFCIRQGKI